MPEDAAPIINDEIREWIGREGAVSTATVTAESIRQYATAVGIGGVDQLFVDASFARETPYGDTVAPFLFFSIPFSALQHASQLKDDGIPTGAIGNAPRPPIPLPRTMAGGTEVEYIRPIHPGDILTQQSRISDINERAGASGQLVFTTTETTYRDAAGEPVVIVRSTTISR